MAEAAKITSDPHSPPEAHQVDQRVVLHDVTWEEFETVLAIRGESSGVRMTYLDGELELMTPSSHHERIKKCLARLLEAYALEEDIDLQGVGSWTVKDELRELGVEPDECYVVEPRSGEEPKRPDFAIDVVWTSGGLDKLEVYRGLEVPEVWIWEKGRLEIHRLESGRYAPSERSRLLPDLDPALLMQHLDPEYQTRATREYLAALRRG